MYLCFPHGWLLRLAVGLGLLTASGGAINVAFAQVVTQAEKLQELRARDERELRRAHNNNVKQFRSMPRPPVLEANIRRCPGDSVVYAEHCDLQLPQVRESRLLLDQVVPVASRREFKKDRERAVYRAARRRVRCGPKGVIWCYEPPSP